MSTVVNDPEYVEYSCLFTTQVENLLKNEIEEFTKALSVFPSVAKLLLHFNGWNIEQIKVRFFDDSKRFLLQNGMIADNCSTSIASTNRQSSSLCEPTFCNSNKNIGECSICCDSLTKELVSLDCGHLFCRNCWQCHMEMQLQNGMFFFSFTFKILIQFLIKLL